MIDPRVKAIVATFMIFSGVGAAIACVLNWISLYTNIPTVILLVLWPSSILLIGENSYTSDHDKLIVFLISMVVNMAIYALVGGVLKLLHLLHKSNSEGGQRGSQE
jgi:hypothetical protein